ncbi:MAG: ATP-binding protein [Pseudobacteriovorax sp.]|nr:ATP-binding protein [Pseudobacteriovorax sp.]
MTKTKRKLTEELFSPAPGKTDHTEIPYCALREHLDCCDGIGYNLKPVGAFLRGNLCDCVSSCETCFGKTRSLQSGSSVPCRTPSPNRIVNVLNQAQIPARYCYAKLDNFVNFTGNGRQIRQFVASWVREFNPNAPQGLILGGPVGVGKTYLLAAIAKNFAARGLSVKFVDFFQLLNEIKGAYAHSRSDSNILNPLIDVDILFIDELGKGRSSDWEMSIIDQIIMGRYNRNKIIVATTNYNLGPERYTPMNQKDLDEGSFGNFNLDGYETLEKRVGQRIYSRLVETCLIKELTGEDYRKQLIPKLQETPPPPQPNRSGASRGLDDYR